MSRIRDHIEKRAWDEGAYAIAFALLAVAEQYERLSAEMQARSGPLPSFPDDEKPAEG